MINLIDKTQLINSLDIFWKGMLAIFFAITIIYFVIKILNLINKKNKKN